MWDPTHLCLQMEWHDMSSNAMQQIHTYTNTYKYTHTNTNIHKYTNIHTPSFPLCRWSDMTWAVVEECIVLKAEAFPPFEVQRKNWRIAERFQTSMQNGSIQWSFQQCRSSSSLHCSVVEVGLILWILCLYFCICIWVCICTCICICACSVEELRWGGVTWKGPIESRASRGSGSWQPCALYSSHRHIAIPVMRWMTTQPKVGVSQLSKMLGPAIVKIVPAIEKSWWWYAWHWQEARYNSKLTFRRTC